MSQTSYSLGPELVIQPQKAIMQLTPLKQKILTMFLQALSFEREKEFLWTVHFILGNQNIFKFLMEINMVSSKWH
jgi:hypothetical protein